MGAADGQGARGTAGGSPGRSHWRGQPHWRILHLGAGDGLGFLRTWRAWKDDPHRPALLHYLAVDEAFCTADVLSAAAHATPGLRPLARALTDSWYGLLPGFHRLAFEEGRVLLTVGIGEPRALLREMAFTADAMVVDGPGAVDLYRLKALARLCRRGTRLAWAGGAAPLAADLRQCGFVPASRESLAVVEPASADAPVACDAVFDPSWASTRAQARPMAPGRCIVVGAGLAGAAVAASLARRGWAVEVLDALDTPAGGASSLPAGLLVPHQSPDDSLLSRLSRAGLRMTLNEVARLLVEGRDWAQGGVLAHRPDIASTLPADPAPELAAWSRVASDDEKVRAGLAPGPAALWHAHAAWVRPAALVQAWLAQTGVRWRGGMHVASIERAAQGWRLLARHGDEVARGDLVVVAAAHASARLLPMALPLQPVRGQVSWSTHAAGHALTEVPVTGDGHFLPNFPSPGGPAWLCGATFDRDDTDLTPRRSDHTANLERLARLVPQVAAQLTPRFAKGEVQAWTGVRCASADRRPLMGEVAPGFWVSTAMGSRGLTFAHLCAELMAARLHAEPLPLPQKLAAALNVRRVRPSAAP